MSTSEVDAKLKDFRALQAEIQNLYSQKTGKLSQFNENTLVKGELDLLCEEIPVFKLVGPVLMTIEIKEAKDNVQKRLEFIEGEIQKLDDSIAKKQGEQADLSETIQSLQMKMQREASAAANAVIQESS